MVSDETFFAWLDGELDAQEAALVEAAVTADPRLSAMAAEHRAMQGRLKGAFDPVIDAPVPEALLAAFHSHHDAGVIHFAKHKRRDEPRNWPSVPQWAAMAATLAIGILVGTILPHERGTAPVEVEGGRMYAAGTLSRALDTQLASAPSGGVRIGITFRDQRGAICRSFTSSSSSGLACRDNGRWQMRGLFGASEGQHSDYRMAGG